MNSKIDQYMAEAIRCARENGTPYAAMLFDPESGHKIVAANSVRADKDPTAHAEVNAIRRAAAAGMDLKRCVLISTCEPCPMCAMASVWAGVRRIYFGATIDDAARFGRQVDIYCEEIAERSWYDVEVAGGVLRADCVALFEGRG